MKIKFFIVWMVLCMSSQTYACPACVGTIDHDSPPFFADEFCSPQNQECQYDTLLSGTNNS
jgi:hypothetical protein